MSVVRGSVTRDFVNGTEVSVDSTKSSNHSKIAGATTTAVSGDSTKSSNHSKIDVLYHHGSVRGLDQVLQPLQDRRRHHHGIGQNCPFKRLLRMVCHRHQDQTISKKCRLRTPIPLMSVPVALLVLPPII